MSPRRGVARRSRAPRFAPALLLVVACGEGSGAPTTLRFASPSPAASYRAEYTQEIEWGPVLVTRELRAKYALGVGTGGAGRLDSLAVVITTPHGRQVVSARHLLDREFTVTPADRGGSPEYGPELPALDLGAAQGGETPISLLIDYGFPELPNAPVGVGDTWSGRTTRRQVEGNMIARASLTTEYRLVAWDSVGGSECARIEGVTSGELVGEDEGRTYEGRVNGRAEWCLDPSAGVLVELSSEEQSDGEIRAGEAVTRVRQRTSVGIVRADTP